MFLAPRAFGWYMDVAKNNCRSTNAARQESGSQSIQNKGRSGGRELVFHAFDWLLFALPWLFLASALKPSGSRSPLLLLTYYNNLPVPSKPPKALNCADQRELLQLDLHLSSAAPCRRVSVNPSLQAEPAIVPSRPLGALRNRPLSTKMLPQIWGPALVPGRRA